MSSPVHDATLNDRKITWPDFSEYGLYFCVMEIDGKRRLVMVDINNWYPSLARSMGFSRVKKYQGVYVRDDLKLSFPKKWLEVSFPRMKNVQTTMGEVIRNVKERMVMENRDIRMSRLGVLNRIPWSPADVRRQSVNAVLGHFALSGAPQTETRISVDTALKQVSFIGSNYKGEHVYESATGERFISENGLSVDRREDGNSFPADFIRAPNEESFNLCAAGIVLEISKGRKLSLSDLERYLEAMMGEVNQVDQESFRKLQRAIDVNICDFASRIGMDDFDNVVSMHSNRPVALLKEGEIPTPAPLSYLMQGVVDTYLRSSGSGTENPVVVERGAFESEHSFLLRKNGSKVVFSSDSKKIPHNVFIGGDFDSVIQKYRNNGIDISSTSQQMIVEALESRSDKGLSIFVVTAEKNGILTPENRRTMAWLGSRYYILGVIDVDSSLIAPGNKINSRVIVVGNKKPSIDLSYVPPGKFVIALDYGYLRGFFSAVSDLVAGRETVFPAEYQSISDLSANDFQVPYIPASSVSEPANMVPRNMFVPIRQALNSISENTGMDIDGFVASKLGITEDELADGRLSAEQVDAVAIGISKIDSKSGMILADQTGVGKGRTLATLMTYAKKIGKKPVFITENPDLFNLIFRDIKAVGSLDKFRNVLIMGTNIRILDDGKVIARSATKEKIDAVIASGGIPDEYDAVFATYGQFNREQPSSAEIERHYQVVGFNEMRSNGASFLEAIRKFPGIKTFEFLNKEIGSRVKALMDSNLSDDELVEELDKLLKEKSDKGAGGGNTSKTSTTSSVNLSDLKKVAELRSLVETKRIKEPLSQTALRQAWFANLKGHVLFADECHNATGQNSNVGKNMRANINGAYAFIASSATPASREENYILYGRMFPEKYIDINTIPNTLKKGGEPLIALLSTQLASDGSIIRREHDLSNVEFTTFINPNKEKNTVLADQMAEVLNAIAVACGEIEDFVTQSVKSRQVLLNAAESPIKGKAGFITSGFGSKFWAVNQHFLAAMNARYIADLAVDAISTGLKPVIYTENTFESVIRDAWLDHIGAKIEKDDTDLVDGEVDVEDDEDLDYSVDKIPDEGIRLNERLTFKKVLKGFLRSIWSGTEIVRNDSGKIIVRKKVEIDMPRKQAIIDEIDSMIDKMEDIPISPIDVIRNRIMEAGYTVDEISGRKLMVEDREDGIWLKKRHFREKVHIRNDFNNNGTDAIIITKSGATGIDLHAGKEFLDQRQRVMIIAKIPNNVLKMIQALGRVHRTGQVCPPKVYIPYLGMPGERRDMIRIKQKCRKINATVKANGESEDVSEYDAPDIFNHVGNRVCREFLAENPEFAKRLMFREYEISGVEETSQDPCKFVDRVTSRISLLPSADQERVYNEIEARFKEYIEKCEMEGHNPLNTDKYDIKAVMKNRVLLIHGNEKSKSAFAAPVYACEIEYEDREAVSTMDVPPEQRLAMINSEIDSAKKRSWNGDVVASLMLKKLDDFLPKLLAKNYQTVNEALNSNENNRVKMVDSRVRSLAAVLPLLDTGAIYTIHTDSGTDRCLVLSHVYPEYENIMDTNQYQIRVLSEKHKRTALVSLPVLAQFYASGNITDIAPQNLPGRNERILSFLEELRKNTKKTTTRIVLTGNLYRAAEFAVEQRKGKPANYTDENGVWHAGIMMPVGMSMDDVLYVPAQIKDSDTLMDFLRMRFSLKKDKYDKFGIAFVSESNKHEDHDIYVSMKDVGVVSFMVNLNSRTVDFIKSARLQEAGISFRNISPHFFVAHLMEGDPEFKNKLDTMFALCSQMRGGLRIYMNKENREWMMNREAARIAAIGADLNDVSVDFDIEKELKKMSII